MYKPSLLRLLLDYFCLFIVNQRYKILKRAEMLHNSRLVLKLGSHGQGVGFYGTIRISAPEKMKLGNNVHIGNNAYIRADGGLTIGDNTHISRNLVLYTLNHDYHGTRLPYDENKVTKPVVIGRNVWIGMNVCILPGTNIGDGAIVGMGTVVNGDVPPMSIIGSQKWQMLKQRDIDHYTKLDHEQSYGGPSGFPFVIDKQ